MATLPARVCDGRGVGEAMFERDVRNQNVLSKRGWEEYNKRKIGKYIYFIAHKLVMSGGGSLTVSLIHTCRSSPKYS